MQSDTDPHQHALTQSNDPGRKSERCTQDDAASGVQDGSDYDHRSVTVLHNSMTLALARNPNPSFKSVFFTNR